MTHWIKLSNSAALVAISLTLSFGSPAWAERPNETESDPAVVLAPSGTLTVPALQYIETIDASITALAKESLFDRLTVDWTGLLNFYVDNKGLALFTTPSGLSPLGQQLRTRLPVAAAAGMPVPAEILAAVADMPMPTSPQDQDKAEALLAAVFVGTAVDATTILGDADEHGALVMNQISAAQDKGDIGLKNLLNDQLPSYYRFWALANYLPTQVAFLEQGGWPEVPNVKKLEPGKTDPAVKAIRARLSVTGELSIADMGTDDLYDTKLAAAVELFQRNHGLNDDGVIGGRTIEEFNVSAEERVRQILLNLERMRADGPNFEQRHLIANIPSQEVKVIEDRQVTFYTKAIFGKLQRKSPTLSSVIHTVKLNPDWTAPAKIAAIDEVKRERANPGFLEAKGFTIYDRSGNAVSPNAIDWHSAGPGNFPYTLRQAPGPENALGPVKFDFPNDHAVFIHGTPTIKLFDKQDRFFSSGCVRAHQPVELAKFLLKDDPEWPAERIDAVLKTAKTMPVKLKNPLPVHITYVTAWVDESGIMQFRKDAYGYDDLPKLPSTITQRMVAASQVPAAVFSQPDQREGKGK